MNIAFRFSHILNHSASISYGISLSLQGTHRILPLTDDDFSRVTLVGKCNQHLRMLESIELRGTIDLDVGHIV